MNQDLTEMVKKYSIGSHQELNSYLIGKSKDTLIAMLTDLLTVYINDKNSSTIREFVTVSLAGYIHKESKIGYNGFKQDVFVSSKTIKCEAKPRNFDTEQIERFNRGDRKTMPSKLDGGGSFNDYTFARLRRDKSEKDLNILPSGFIDGKLIYIFEFPFSSNRFVARLREQLKVRFKDGKDIPREYLRGANFDYRHYKDSPNLRGAFLLSKNELQKYKAYFVKGFFEFLEGKAE